MEAQFRKLTTKEKALALNLDEKVYGSIAEIGGGQETAANFFKAGGASGSIAKTMSAYDMKFSDEIYGPAPRYVCQDRLFSMLDHEFDLLEKRLTHRAHDTRFFSYANTIETINFKKTNQGNGWMGIRFQLTPEAEPNECIIHVRLNDTESLWQQQVLGDLGVNLIYGCFHYRDPEGLLLSLVDNLSHGRIEIDMFQLSGPNFKHVDNRLMSLLLVKNGLTKLAMFGPEGNVLQPSEALYKKNILLLRGRFRPVTLVNVDMMITGYRNFRNDPEVSKENILGIAELTLNDLTLDGSVDERDFLYRVDLLCSLGQTVMISNYQEYYRLINYLTQFTKGRKIGMILGVYNLHNIFDEKYYSDIRGGILEAFGILFGKNVILYVYPSLGRSDQKLYTLKDFKTDKAKGYLLRYLMASGKIDSVNDPKTSNLHIISDEVLKMIRIDQSGWEDMVPKKVAHAIKENSYFDYPKEPPLPVLIGSSSKTSTNGREKSKPKPKRRASSKK